MNSVIAKPTELATAFRKMRLLLWCPAEFLGGRWTQRPFLRWGTRPPSDEDLVRGFFTPHLHDSARDEIRRGELGWEHPTYETFVSRWASKTDGKESTGG